MNLVKLYTYNKYVMALIVIGLLSTCALCIYSTHKIYDDEKIYKSDIFNVTTSSITSLFISVFTTLYISSFLYILYKNDDIVKILSSLEHQLINK